MQYGFLKKDIKIESNFNVHGARALVLAPVVGDI
jgi:hypothetical protein